MTAISGRTRLLALIADPVIQARSPGMANALLEERGRQDAFVLVPMQQLAGKFLLTMKEYPPSQTPGSFNLEKIQKMIEASASGR